MAWRKYSRSYIGNMKPFLDETMERLNTAWDRERRATEGLVSELFEGAATAATIFGENAGRKFKDGRFERSLNRAVFEVQAYYFSYRAIRSAALKKRQSLLAAFKELSRDSEFAASIESTTKSIENYRTRFDKYRQMLQRTLEVDAEGLTFQGGRRVQ